MKKIVNKTTGDYYIGTALDEINNNIRYQLNNPDGSVKKDAEGNDISGIIYCENMWLGLDGSQCETSDVGLTGREVSCNFATGLLWAFNELQLNQSEWEVQS